MSLLDRFAAPLVRLPVDLGVANASAEEFAVLPPARRRAAVRKLWQREGLLFATGQAALRRERVPADARRVLWIVTWTTVGDAILDLAARALVPRSVELELCIAPSLAPLFAHDARFSRVHTQPASCASGRFDFVLLDVLSTAAIRLKTRHFRMLPFATLRGHLLGERFDRAACGDRRLRQLFGLSDGEVVAPWLSVPLGRVATSEPDRQRIAVPLGARVPAKRYPHWPETLERIAAGWSADLPRPRFVLLGHGADARADLDRFRPVFLDRHAAVAIDDHGTLADAARTIAGCDGFLGMDGGLMHVAIALGVPGLAVFAGVDPCWFLRPESTMAALRWDGRPTDLSPTWVSDAFMGRCRMAASVRPPGSTADPRSPSG